MTYHAWGPALHAVGPAQGQVHSKFTVAGGLRFTAGGGPHVGLGSGEQAFRTPSILVRFRVRVRVRVRGRVRVRVMVRVMVTVRLRLGLGLWLWLELGLELGLEVGLELGLGVDLHFAVWFQFYRVHSYSFFQNVVYVCVCV